MSFKLHSGGLLCVLFFFLTVNGHPHQNVLQSLRGNDLPSTSSNKPGEHERSHSTRVRHVVVHVEVPEEELLKARSNRKRARRFGPNKVCRILKRRFGSNMVCTGKKWNVVMSENELGAPLDKKSAQSLMTNELPSAHNLPQFESTPIRKPVMNSSELSFTTTLLRCRVMLKKKEIPHTWERIFPKTLPILYERPGDNLCNLVTELIQSEWSVRCSTICSGRLFNQTTDYAEFSMRLYFPHQLAAEHCPDVKESTTQDTVVDMLNRRLVEGTPNSLNNNMLNLTASFTIQLNFALLRLELQIPQSMAISLDELQQTQSETYQFAQNEMTHQLEQIILLQQMDETVKHFKFCGFNTTENRSAFALFVLTMQSSEFTLKQTDKQLQNGLSTTQASRISVNHRAEYRRYPVNSSVRGVCALNLTIERQKMTKISFDKLLDKRSAPYRLLDYQLQLFVFSALRRCDLYDCIETFETNITPTLHHLDISHLTSTLEVTVNHTALILEHKSDPHSLLYCLDKALVAEASTWMISAFTLQRMKNITSEPTDVDGVGPLANLLAKTTQISPEPTRIPSTKHSEVKVTESVKRTPEYTSTTAKTQTEARATEPKKLTPAHTSTTVKAETETQATQTAKSTPDFSSKTITKQTKSSRITKTTPKSIIASVTTQNGEEDQKDSSTATAPTNKAVTAKSTVSKSMSVLQVGISKEKAISSNNKIFNNTRQAFHDRPGDILCTGIRQSVQARWSILCTPDLKCSGRLLNESETLLRFSVLLYYPPVHSFKYCPDLYENKTLTKLNQVLNHWLLEEPSNEDEVISSQLTTLFGSQTVQRNTILLELHLDSVNWNAIPFVGSDTYEFIRAEVTHQLEQILRIQRLNGTLRDFEFSGFTQDQNDALVALFQLFFDPHELTSEIIVENVQNGLDVLHSINVTHDHKWDTSTTNSGLQFEVQFNLTVEKFQSNLGIFLKTQENGDLDPIIPFFLHWAMRRCALMDFIDKLDYKILQSEPSSDLLGLSALINRTKLQLDGISSTPILICMENGWQAEMANWVMVSVITVANNW